MTDVTIFLAGDDELRISFDYSETMVAAIKAIAGTQWNPASKTWRAPLSRLDAVLAVFGDDVGLAPEVVMAARPMLPVEVFADNCAAAGVTLAIVPSPQGDRVEGSGGCWTGLLQAEIDKRADGLIALIRGGWLPQVVTPVNPPPVPTNYDQLSPLDYVMAKGEHLWHEEAARQEERIKAARRKRQAKKDPLQQTLFKILNPRG